ncbi:MAG: endonuclease/exonuclease/phosphatase family protein [Candidatus Paceibacterota bacterium]
MGFSNVTLDESLVSGATVNVITWNIDHYPSDIFERVEVSIKTLSRYKPDILLLQECSYEVASVISRGLGLALCSFSEHGEAVLSNMEVKSAGSSFLGDGRSAGISYAHLSASCHDYLAVSAHFTWGGGRESLRVGNSLEVDSLFTKYFEEYRGDNLIGILGGDLNAEPNADSVRFLRGECVISDRSTLYTDLWGVGRDGGYTSSKDNPYAYRTAVNVGLRPDTVLTLPDRRIDYLFVKGYAYCKAGAAISCELVGNVGEISSDHYGVFAKLSC